jgi:hypothetical protein
MLVEDYKPEMYYKPGPLNVEADFLSRYPILPRSKEKAEQQTNDHLEHHFYEAMINYPVDIHLFPLDFQLIRTSAQ